MARSGRGSPDRRPLLEFVICPHVLVHVESVLSEFTFVCPFICTQKKNLFASRYPTSPSEGNFLYDCLGEGLQTKEKLERLN